MLRLATADNKKKIDDYREDSLLRYRRMAQELNGSIAWESEKAHTLQKIDETATILICQCEENLLSIETYLKQKAARRIFANEVKGVIVFSVNRTVRVLHAVRSISGLIQRRLIAAMSTPRGH